MKVNIECSKIEFADMVHNCERGDCERRVIKDGCDRIGAEYLASVTTIVDPNALL